MSENEIVEYIRARYGTMTCRELCAELGITENHFNWLQKKHGFRKDPEVLKAMRSASMRRNRTDRPHPQTEETRRKMSESRNRLIRSERARELYGLERKTKIKVFGVGDKARYMRWKLKKKGYGVNGGHKGNRDVTVLESTERNNRMERNAAAMHFRFFNENGERIA